MTKATLCLADILGAAARIRGRADNTTLLPASIGAELVLKQEIAQPTAAFKLRAEWLHPGLHIIAMGADQSGKNGIEARALADTDLYVADSAAQCARLGELRAARRARPWSRGLSPELGQVVTGAHPGRTAPEQVKICDLTGTGAQDTAIATHALRAVLAAGAGTRIET